MIFKDFIKGKKMMRRFTVIRGRDELYFNVYEKGRLVGQMYPIHWPSMGKTKSLTLDIMMGKLR